MKWAKHSFLAECGAHPQHSRCPSAGCPPPSLLVPLRPFDLRSPLFRLPRCQGKPASSELSSARASVGSQPLWLSQLDHTELVQYFTVHPLPLRIPLRVIQARASGPRASCGAVCGLRGPAGAGTQPRAGRTASLSPAHRRASVSSSRRGPRTLGRAAAGEPPGGLGSRPRRGTEPRRSRPGEPAQPSCRAGMGVLSLEAALVNGQWGLGTGKAVQTRGWQKNNK